MLETYFRKCHARQDMPPSTAAFQSKTWSTVLLADDALLIGEMRKDSVARLEAFLDPKRQLVDVLHEQNQ